MLGSHNLYLSIYTKNVAMIQNQLKNVIIWDLSGTLLRASTSNLSSQQKEDFSLLFYLWAGKKPSSSLDTLAASLLHQLKLPGIQHSKKVRNPAGEPIPEIVYRFLAGHLSSAQVFKEIDTFFHDWAQKEGRTMGNQPLLKKMLTSFFDPRAIAQCFIEERLLVEMLYQVSRNPAITNYVISNWDPESFALIYKKYEDTIFSVIPSSHIVISGTAGILKPQEELFQHFLSKYHLSAKNCFFIDDQSDNIAAAEQSGIEGFKYERNSEDTLKIILQNLKVLNPS